MGSGGDQSESSCHLTAPHAPPATEVASAASSARERPLVVALVCLLADRSHVLAMLRFAAQLQARRPSLVTCFVGEAFRDEVVQCGFDCVALPGLAVDDSATVMSAISRRSVFINAFSNDQDLRDLYWAKLQTTAATLLPWLAEALRGRRPDVVLTDVHVFESVYAHLAAYCGATHLRVAIGGAPLFPVRPFVRAFGWTRRPHWVQSLIEGVGRLSEHGHAVWRRVRHAERRRNTIASTARLQDVVHSLQVVGPRPPSLLVSVGLASLEDNAGLPPRTYRSDLVARLLPHIDTARAPTPTALSRWMQSAPAQPIVYVSFGTMVTPTARVARAIGEGLLAAGVRILWAQPASRRRWSPMDATTEQLCFVEYAPQSAVLSSGRLAAFVTHAGAGSVQEAVVTGVPMLCVPYGWDHPYVASVAERLGVALVLPRMTISSRKVRNAVSCLVHQPLARDRAAALARTIKARGANDTDWRFVHTILRR